MQRPLCRCEPLCYLERVCGVLDDVHPDAVVEGGGDGGGERGQPQDLDSPPPRHRLADEGVALQLVRDEVAVVGVQLHVKWRVDRLVAQRHQFLERERERNVLFNDALNTFYLRLYGVRHVVKDHSDSERGNPLPPQRLLFPISSKGYFICTIPQTG